MCHAPEKKKKLEDLGDVIGVPKFDIPDKQKEKMEELLQEDPVTFFEYASTDAVVTLLYISSLYGYNNSIPVTITSVSAKVLKRLMMGYLGCTTDAEFDRVFRGLKKVSHGLVPRDDRPGYVESSSLEPISDIANTIQYYASHAYHGGYNSCSEVGYFPFKTYDYDLKNAYPTAMCLVPDLDWENLVRSEVTGRNLDIRDWVGIGGLNPATPFVGYVTFEFPESVKYPCIPVNVEGVPVYPRTSKGLDGVYVAGPFIFLALKLGATVHCKKGYFLNTIIGSDYSESRCLSQASKVLVEERGLAVDRIGKGSLADLLLKEIICSFYGKLAQNVIDKTTWSAFSQSMEALGCSGVTNPFCAMMITSLIQITLISAINQVNALGYVTCSVTTDGFISDCPIEKLESLDLHGIKMFMEQSRIFLSGNPQLWEPKHTQSDLVNFTTRGNVSLEKNGVIARNSTKSGIKKKDNNKKKDKDNDKGKDKDKQWYYDRLWLMIRVLKRESSVEYKVDEWTPFKDLARGENFRVKKAPKNVSMDFDMKRKPIKTSFRTDRPIIETVEAPIIMRKEYEIAHFDTEPFETVDEFLYYRSKKKLCPVLRTESHWKNFWSRIENNSSGPRIKDIKWSILNSCVMGFRAGRWSIPMLEKGSREEKCAWLNTHNDSSKEFKLSDWKNARRRERQINMLPESVIRSKLDELINDTRK